MGLKFGLVGIQTRASHCNRRNPCDRRNPRRSHQITIVGNAVGQLWFVPKRKSGDRKSIENPRSPPIQLVFYEESAAQLVGR